MSSSESLLRNLYSSASGKYLKFKERLDKAIQNGRFRQLTKRRQHSLLARLRKLYQKLKSLQTQLRLAGAGAALVLALSGNPVQAQGTLGPFVRNNTANPLIPPVTISHARPALVDIDADGDLDIFVGDGDGNIHFFRNDNTDGNVEAFVEITGTGNPFNGVLKGGHAAPAFADVDGDGDFDMLMGVNYPLFNPPGGPTQYDYSPTFFFRNTGTATNPVFTEQTGGSNPFNGVYGAKYGPSLPVFVDIDGDSDIDLFVGGSYSSDLYGANPAMQFFENQGTTAAPNFVFTPHSLSYLYFGSSTPTFVDVDDDGDMDAIVGTSYSGVRFFRQGIENQFSEVYGTDNPFYGLNMRNHSAPAAGDLDGDGDLDFIVGSSTMDSPYGVSTVNSNLYYIENTDGAFTLENRTYFNISPFGGVDVGREAAPVFTDLDGDNDLDIVIGSKYSSPPIFIYKNNDGVFVADPDHPLVAAVRALPGLEINIKPVFVDIDDDGDQDVFVCKGYTIQHLRNNAGNYVETTNPLNVGSVARVSIAFIDVDNNNTLDVLVSSGSTSTLTYFRNSGTAANPTFVSATPPAPFNTFNFEGDTNLSAVDLDNDGDLDLATSETYYNGWYGDSDATRTSFFENNGDGTFTLPAEPVIIEVPPLAFTSFADIDGDGDLDAFVGNGHSFDFPDNGRVTFFENTNPPPVTNVVATTLIAPGGEPIVIDPTLTINDPDDDDIAFATVTISDFVEGEEELGFTEMDGIVGDFDAETGVLTFIGRAPIEDYEDLLRTVTFNFTGTVPDGRKGRMLDLAQNITFQVRDTDFTLTTVSVVSLNVVPGSPASEINIYNALSPNKDDNANPFFKIEHIEAVSPENKVTIFNRWGDVVFEVSNYDNSEAGKRFEGTSNNGKDLPSGTYFYKIEITGQTITGYLSLKR